MILGAWSAVASCQWCTFSLLRATMLAFCVLNAACAFLFAWMMDSTEMVVFRIPAIEHKWDLRVKAMACRRAGLFFIFFFFLILLAPLWNLLRDTCRLVFFRLRFCARRNCRKVVLRDQRRPLRWKESDSEIEEMLGR
ncbi:hypothetical protein TcYC6_0089590 [Trypanosoma cruzi]|nr:hypothetical protein TcYC6_0089590 [Trypanosoma cruzi]